MKACCACQNTRWVKYFPFGSILKKSANSLSFNFYFEKLEVMVLKMEYKEESQTRCFEQRGRPLGQSYQKLTKQTTVQSQFSDIKFSDNL